MTNQQASSISGARWTHPTAITILFILSTISLAIIINKPITTIRLLILLSTEGILGTAIYRLTLHPLSHIPGPWYAAVADWYTLYRCLVGNRHLDFHRLHLKYGPVFRFGPNRVSFCSADALNPIYGVRANTQKSKVYAAFMHFFHVPASLTTIDRKAHSFKRRVTSRALTPASVKCLEELILRNVRIFCSLLAQSKGDIQEVSSAPHNESTDVTDGLARGDEKGWSDPKDMTKLIQFLLSDVMGDVTFSRNWNAQLSEANRPILDLLPLGTAGINLAGHIPTVLKLKLEGILFPSLMQGIVDFRALSESQSSWRVKQKPKDLPQRDLFQALLDARDPDTGLGYTNQDLIAEAGILIIAGADTTATTLTATLFYILHDEKVLKRAIYEVENAFREVKTANGDKYRARGLVDPESVCIGPELTSCKFLFACIEEALRMSPAVGAMLPREVIAGGLNVEGLFIPAGIDVGVPIYALHHDSRFHPDPHTYHPERWLEGETWTERGEDSVVPGTQHSTTAQDILREQSAFEAFGWGRTSCIGKYLSYQEIGIVLCRLLLEFDMRLDTNSSQGEGREGLGWGRHRKGEFQTRDMFTSTHEGPVVQFRRRV